MTSNLGGQFIQDLGERDYEEMKSRVLEVLRNTFRPEFLNRVDEIVIFHSLSREHIEKIIDIQLEYLRKRLKERKLSLELSERAKQLIADKGYDPVYGARPLKRAIQRYIQDQLALQILEGKFAEGDTVTVDSDSKTDGMSFSVKKG
jgi:ATP-dependent Clp protease ATP-binding subunit ClpB